MKFTRTKFNSKNGKPYIYDKNELPVVAVREPRWTKSWHPISHRRVIHALTDVLEANEMPVIDKRYDLASNDMNCFATWIIGDGNGRHHMIGFRNSMNKSFPLGFCSGLHITVCSNMMFSGEFETFHRHTAGMNDQLLEEMSLNAFLNIERKTQQFECWHDGLFNFDINERELKAVSFDAMAKGLIPTQRFNNYIDCLKEEVSIADDLSLGTFHGGVTRLIRSDSLFSQSNRNGRLMSFCDDYMMGKAA